MINVDAVGEVTKTVVETCGVSGFNYVSNLLPAAANLRKVCSVDQVICKTFLKMISPSQRKQEVLNSTRYKEILKGLGFRFTEYDNHFLISSQTQHLTEAVVFRTSCNRDSNMGAMLVRDYGLDEYFSGHIPENYPHFRQLETGHVLGYPVCCVRHFFLSKHISRDLQTRMVPTNEWPEGAKTYEAAIVPWRICSPTCKPSIEYAKNAVELYSRYLSLPEEFTITTPSWDEESIQRRYRIKAHLEAYPACTEEYQMSIAKTNEEIYQTVMGVLVRLKSTQFGEFEN